MKFGNQVGFLVVSKMGAGPAMPTREQLNNVFGEEEEDDGRYDGLEDHCFFGLIRHAEKANLHDKDNPRWIIKYDPPTSRRGDRQAEFTAQYLYDYFEKHNMKFDKFVIQSSPFMRCIKTANETAVKFGVTEIEINYMVSEHLYPRDYPD